LEFFVAFEFCSIKKVHKIEEIQARDRQTRKIAEICIISQKIPGYRARSPPETCLEQFFNNLLIVLIVGQP
jgi:hypothetical protein